MLPLLVAAAAMATAPTQAAIASSRQAFNTCVHDATVAAKEGKVAVEAYHDFVMGRCDSQAAALRNAQVGFDVSNGVARKTATSDAQSMIEDRLAGAKDNYELRMSGN
jgi:hypothetical protein